jgi:fermentation-respiration switch protein FrsA (DUF1100 family)
MLLNALIVLAIAFGGFVALMYAAQRALLYHPDRTRTLPASVGLTRAKEIELTTADVERLVAWHVAPQGERPVVLYFHGNAGALAYRAERFHALTADGLGLVALSYRGYGGSTGSPTETGLLADAEAAYAFAAARYAPARLLLWGESLGTGVAVALAATRPVGAVVLEAPYTSIADVGAQHYWFLPVRPLVKDPFRSDLRIGKVTAPLLVLHGARDTVVPIGFGERLFALANEPKRFARFADAGHGDLDRAGALAAFRDFLDQQFAGKRP